MEYLDKGELRRLLGAAYSNNKLHHLCLLVGFWHGLRVSEAISIEGKDIQDGLLSVKRLKKSKPTIQPLHVDTDPLFDESPLTKIKGRMFPYTRQYVDKFVKKYGELAGIHPDKRHYHALKHSVAMIVYENTKSLPLVQSYLGHKAASSTLQYLYEADASKAQKVIKEMKIE